MNYHPHELEILSRLDADCLKVYNLIRSNYPQKLSLVLIMKNYLATEKRTITKKKARIIVEKLNKNNLLTSPLISKAECTFLVLDKKLSTGLGHERGTHNDTANSYPSHPKETNDINGLDSYFRAPTPVDKDTYPQPLGHERGTLIDYLSTESKIFTQQNSREIYINNVFNINNNNYNYSSIAYNCNSRYDYEVLNLSSYSNLVDVEVDVDVDKDNLDKLNACAQLLPVQSFDITFDNWKLLCLSKPNSTAQLSTINFSTFEEEFKKFKARHLKNHTRPRSFQAWIKLLDGWLSMCVSYSQEVNLVARESRLRAGSRDFRFDKYEKASTSSSNSKPEPAPVQELTHEEWMKELGYDKILEEKRKNKETSLNEE